MLPRPRPIFIRPSVVFGPDDAFLQPIAALLRRVPIFPIFGRGETALQPSHVEDVAEATVRSLDAPKADVIYELGGPRVYSYKELLALIGEHVGSRPLLLPVPFVMWRPMAFAAEMLPTPPITRNRWSSWRSTMSPLANTPASTRSMSSHAELRLSSQR